MKYTKLIAKIATTTAALLMPAVCFSAPTTISFKGEVTRIILEYWEDGNVAKIGDEISGSFTYESDLPNISTLQNSGAYQDISPGIGISLTIPGRSISPSPDFPYSSGLWLSTSLNSATSPATQDTFGVWQYFDGLSLNNISNIYSIGISFNLKNRLNSINLPTEIDNQAISEGYVQINFNDGSILIGSINHVATAVPEPSTIALALFGVIYISTRRWKRTA